MQSAQKIISKTAILIIALLILVGSYYISTNSIDKIENQPEVVTEQDITPLDLVDKNDTYQNLPTFLRTSNLKHILEGNINRNNQATGYHHKASAPNNQTKVLNIIATSNKCGVYKAKVQVQGKPKSAFSTMFPDNLNANEVRDSIISGYNNGTNKYPANSSFTINTNQCYDIFIVLDSQKKIITSYPIY
jgi:Bacterial EndoU nuclease